jgi:hypothetical protein
MLKDMEIAQDELDAEVVQCWGRSDSSGSSSALSSPLSLISSLQLDELELELELEDELEELELNDHLEGPLLLLGWRVETLAFSLDVANEDGDALREGFCTCLYSAVGWTVALRSNRLETMVEMHRRGRLEAITRSWSHLEVGPGRPAWHVGPVGPTCQPPGSHFVPVSSRIL